MIFDSITIIGTAGAAIVLVGFLMNQLNRWSNASLKYDVSNAIGSGLLVWYAILLHSLPFVVLNSVWFLFSLRDSIQEINRPK